MRFRSMQFMAKSDDAASTVADAVTDAVADVGTALDDKKSDEKDSTKDAEVALFCRNVADAVTKSIAELLHPSAPPADDEEEVEEDGKKVKRKKRKPADVPKPKQKYYFMTLFG